MLTLHHWKLLAMAAIAGSGSGIYMPEEPNLSAEIMPFLGGKSAAFSLEFDDSMVSQVQNALPLLKERNIPATFFVNPGVGHYAQNKPVWEEQVLADGHDLGNHTWMHTGATSVAEAEDQIAKCAEVLERLNKHRPKLMMYMTPGGVPWTISRPELDQILARHLLVFTPREGMTDDASGGDPTAYARRAVQEKRWVVLGLHGVGGEWLSTSTDKLASLLDFVREHRAELWMAKTLDVHKYVVERRAAKPVQVKLVSPKKVEVSVECDEAIAKPYGQPFTTLFDQPLTVRVSVPEDWNSFVVEQGSHRPTGEIARVGGKPVAQFDILPNVGKATLIGQ